MSTPSPSSSRPSIVCPDSGPEPPYPLRMEGEVISGFGRGSKELGIPTANLPVDSAVTPWIDSVRSGVYFGYASLALPPTHPDYDPSTAAPAAAPSSAQQPADGTSTDQQQGTTGGGRRWHVYPMVMSIGYNPFYGNRVRSAEVHVLRRFRADFYGAPLRLLVLGFVRDERGDYDGVDALVADIRRDCAVARRSLARPAWTPHQGVVFAPAEDGEPELGPEPERGQVKVRGEERVSRGELDGSWLVREEEGA